MLLRYFLDESGHRVYTLKKTAPEGSQTFSAHPAKFSPEDKCRWPYTGNGVEFFDKNFVLFLHNKWAKRRLVMSFVFFFVGWKVFGYTLTEMGLYVYDEETGKGHYRTPAEARELRNKLELEHDRRLKKPMDVKSFPLDA